MNKAYELIAQTLQDDTFEKISFSSARIKGDVKAIIACSVTNKSELKVEYRHQKHNDIKTLEKNEFVTSLEEYLKSFKQVLVKTKSKEIQILLNKKQQAKIITKEVSSSNKEKHNRDKNYLIPDGVPCPFLEAIGVMDAKGRVKSNYYKKFRQINRFLEMVDDLYKNEELSDFHAVDFGCGKSYLTFALYHYFLNIRQGTPKITGIDLKQEVIDHCNDIAQKLEFSELKFAHGFIHDFKSDDPIDFVVTLHACDTATDDAILFSLKNHAKKMMFVPCCQHELNKQLNNEADSIMLKHGIFRDRACAIVTDTMRAQLLELCGYKVQSMEFIDLEHTAKNILLRCVKTQRSNAQIDEIRSKYQLFKEKWSISPYLEGELVKNNFI
jgi:hypothetical protein